jgi:nucleoside-diphosphate kinase
MTMQMTFAMIKSHVMVSDKLAAVLNATFECMMTDRLQVRAMHSGPLEPEKIARLYQEHRDKPYYPDLVRSVSEGAMVMAFVGDDAIARWRAILGATDPNKAAPGTLRARYGSRTHMADNVAHGSDTEQAAWRELAIFFPEQIELWASQGLLVRPVPEHDPASEAGPGHVQ